MSKQQGPRVKDLETTPRTANTDTTSKFKDGTLKLNQGDGLEITFDKRSKPGTCDENQKFLFQSWELNQKNIPKYTLNYVDKKLNGEETLKLLGSHGSIVSVKMVQASKQQRGDTAAAKENPQTEPISNALVAEANPSKEDRATRNDQSNDSSGTTISEISLPSDTVSDETASLASELDTAISPIDKLPTINELLERYELGKEADDEYIKQVAKALDDHPEGAEIELKSKWPFSLLQALFSRHRKSFDCLPENIDQFVVSEFQGEVRKLEPDQEILKRAAEMARDKTALVSDLPETVQGLVAAWEALPRGAEQGQEYDAGRQTIAKRLAVILNTDDQTELQAVDKVLKKYAAEGTSDNPLYIIIFEELSMLMNKQATTKNVRKVAMRFDRDTLIGLVACLRNGSIPKNQGILPPLLDILSETFAQEFYSLRENGKMAQYQNLGDALFDLIMMMDTEAQEPYFWRLFSYMREAWSHIAHNIKSGANESGGARGYLGWLLDKIPLLPDKEMQELFVLSLVIGNTRFEASSEGELVRFLVDYVWQASGADRQSRRMRIDNAIPAGTALHYKFLNSYSYKGQQEAG